MIEFGDLLLLIQSLYQATEVYTLHEKSTLTVFVNSI